MRKYRALSNIEHGVERDSGEVDPNSGAPIIVNEVMKFPYGSDVEGLDTETMKQLWEAGVLEEYEVATPSVERKTSSAQQTTNPTPETPQQPPAAQAAPDSGKE